MQETIDRWVVKQNKEFLDAIMDEIVNRRKFAYKIRPEEKSQSTRVFDIDLIFL